SDFVSSNTSYNDFVMVGSKSWVILSDVERSIKEKIEKVGKPLKEWNIQIYRGVLTGCNEAFIISTDKRNEILSKCIDEAERDRTEKLIRPILRGRDIKRYGYKWSGLWLINTHNGVKGKIERIRIEDYPSVKAYLDQFWDKISTRSDKGDTPYNLRNCAYMEDFDKPKIIYPDIMRLPKSISKIDTYPNIAFDNDGYVPEATLFMMNGESIENICSYLTSDIGFFIFARFYMGPVFDDTGFRFKKEYLLKLPIPLIIKNANHITDDILSKYIDLSQEEMNVILSYKRNLIDFQ
ncbi:TaqI-like C-terminal specificity domain-containing protein, partial [Bacteroides acidifaciens]|uniref:TaqI-like C-terminal specificity domain-containing protein n=1 Tax=Bacteroides acidifaciens TaxID=85831 RepID=UPI002557D62F